MEEMVRKSLGGYILEEELGRGGMAVVYRAHHPEMDRSVAIKVLPREFTYDHTFLERFNREARAIASLIHPHILPVHDFGEEDGSPYIVMALVDGGSLAHRIAASPKGMALDEIMPILRQIADAIDYSHSQGIIHRDLKPSNILFDKHRNAYLTDFGIAKIADSTAQLTGSGLVGTPAYMAPEIATKKGVSPLLDIYSLGVTLFQMITGRLPFDAETPMGVILAHAVHPVPDVREINPELPEGVQITIKNAMAKDPEQRTPDAVTVVKQFERALAGEDVTTFVSVPEEIQDSNLLTTERLDTLSDTSKQPATVDIAADSETVTGSPYKPRRVAVIFRRIGIVVGGLTCFLLIAAILILFGPSWFGKETIDPQRPPRQVEENIDRLGHLMTRIPAGAFIMGGDYPGDGPAHEVTLTRDYWIDIYEVTNLQYKRCVEDGVCLPPGVNQWNPDYFLDVKFNEYPVVNVSWYDAQTYCQWRGGRLPSEAEWEYAAKGDQSITYPWGDDNPSCQLLNYAGCDAMADEEESRGPVPVGSYSDGISPFKLHDMAGNVWEWVGDWYEDYSSEKVINPIGADTGYLRVIRGGSWTSIDSNTIRVSFRGRETPFRFDASIGFRCVLSDTAIQDPEP